MGTSHQRGWVVLRGNKWYGYYRRTVLDPIKNQEKVDTIPIILGQKSQLTKFQARERLEQEITKQSGQTPAGRVMNVTLAKIHVAHISSSGFNRVLSLVFSASRARTFVFILELRRDAQTLEH